MRAIGACACAAMAWLAAGQLLADSWHSAGDTDANELVFATAYDGQALEGRFRQFEVSVETQGAATVPTSLAVSVDVSSADMNDRDLNETLATPDWFNSTVNPTASFTSDTVEQEAPGRFTAAGTLDLKGTSAPATVEFSWSAHDSEAKLAGTARLSRSAWSIGEGEWAGEEHIPDSVDLRFTVELNRSN